MPSDSNNSHPIVDEEQWIAARRQLLEKEKAYSRLRDEVTEARRHLPWRKIDKDYIFQSTGGEMRLGDLFGEQSQLIIYHFMFDPEWDEGCKSCSLIADHYAPSVVHLRNRDVNLVTVSRAPLEKIEAFKQRMGWQFDWVSSYGSDFNFDFYVSWSKEAQQNSEMFHNYQSGKTFPSTEIPAISTFKKEPDGVIYHTYSGFSRGLENFMGVYTLLDLVPKGRDEAALSYGMEWVRHHDAY